MRWRKRKPSSSAEAGRDHSKFVTWMAETTPDSLDVRNATEVDVSKQIVIAPTRSKPGVDNLGRIPFVAGCRYVPYIPLIGFGNRALGHGSGTYLPFERV